MQSLLTLRKLGAAFALAGIATIGFGSTSAIAVTTPTIATDNHLYAITCNDSNQEIQLIEISSDGTATAVGSPTVVAGYTCVPQAAFNPVTQLGYVSVDGSKIYKIDPKDGATTLLSTENGDLVSGLNIAIDDEGKAFASQDCKTVSLNLTSGKTTFLSGYQDNCDGGFYYFQQFAFNPKDGKFYIVNNDNTEDDISPKDNMFYQFPTATGAVFGSTGPKINGDVVGDDLELFKTMSFDTNGVGWTLKTAGGITTLYTIDAATGKYSLVGPVKLGSSDITATSSFISYPGKSGGKLADTGAQGSSGRDFASFALVMLLAGSVLLVSKRFVR